MIYSCKKWIILHLFVDVTVWGNPVEVSWLRPAGPALPLLLWTLQWPFQKSKVWQAVIPGWCTVPRVPGSVSPCLEQGPWQDQCQWRALHWARSEKSRQCWWTGRWCDVPPAVRVPRPKTFLNAWLRLKVLMSLALESLNLELLTLECKTWMLTLDPRSPRACLTALICLSPARNTRMSPT